MGRKPECREAAASGIPVSRGIRASLRITGCARAAAATRGLKKSMDGFFQHPARMAAFVFPEFG